MDTGGIRIKRRKGLFPNSLALSNVYTRANANNIFNSAIIINRKVIILFGFSLFLNRFTINTYGLRRFLYQFRFRGLTFLLCSRFNYTCVIRYWNSTIIECTTIRKNCLPPTLIEWIRPALPIITFSEGFSE